MEILPLISLPIEYSIDYLKPVIMGNHRNSNTYSFFPIITSSVLAFSLSSCTTLTTNKYEATARTIYTWQVEYYPVSTKTPRVESFAATFLINRDGIKPKNAVTGPDDQGLWWPAFLS